MRRIAQELGVEAMSLYYHVKSKDGIIDRIADAVINEIAPRSPEDGWKLALRKRAGSSRAVLARHPWAVALMRNTPRLQR